MQRYLSTPPEDEQAPLAAIKMAACSGQYKNGSRTKSTKRCRSRSPSTSHVSSSAYSEGRKSGLIPAKTEFLYGSGQQFQLQRTRRNSCASISQMSHSAESLASRGSQGSLASHASWSGRKGRKRHRSNTIFTTQEMVFTMQGMNRKGYQCTWCRQAFSGAYQWQRHEESQHAPQEEWICHYTEPSVWHDKHDEACKFCDRHPPSFEQHYKFYHNFERCRAKPIQQRTFARRDHLVQHLKQVHVLEKRVPDLKSWSHAITDSTPEDGWRCGFCHELLPTWKERVRHIKAHFDSGLDMKAWNFTGLGLRTWAEVALQRPGASRTGANPMDNPVLMHCWM